MRNLFIILFSINSVLCSCNSVSNSKELIDTNNFIEIKSNFLQGTNGTLLGRKELIKINKIHFLFVKECFGTSCTGYSYKFDNKGNIVFFRPSYNSSVSKYRYDTNNNLVESSYEFESHDNTYLRITNYYYQDDSNYMEYKAFEDDSLVYESRSSKKSNAGDDEFIQVQLENGFITKQLLLSDLGFPCGDIYKGSHIVLYDYFENGLISEFSITDSLGDTIRRFEYDYGEW